MFPWSIAKSAEAMLSRWAVKRVCKFVLKKKLGKFILGDIDLEQLDVQLTAGTLQLSGLALNVDYLNQKLGAKTALKVKEGSIGSLLVTMPWKGDGCRIEVDELELVLCLLGENDTPDGNEACSSGRDETNTEYLVSGKKDHDGEDHSVRNDIFDVHEGVKTVAKMVKWLLTSFHVKVRKLIVAFDPCIEEGENNEYYRPLVLRMAEADCGIRISEENHSRDEASAENFLGFSCLTNSITFEGAVLEFLQLNSDKQTSVPSTLETSFGQWISESCPLNSLMPIITGKNGGFSGNLKLSIPWKNGSLDVDRVDGDAYLDPLEVRFHPGTIKSFICLWDILKNIDKKSSTVDEAGSIYYNAASNCESSTMFSSVPASEGLLSDRNYLVEKELSSKVFLSESHLISDWASRSQKNISVEESDFGASVHQFFECFDGLRNSQSAMGNSGMWNWTCSVFSAITATTNLASGSLHIPPEQKHTETNFKATAAGISLWFSLIDETNLHNSCMNSNARSSVDYLDATFQDILLLLQVSPKEVTFETTVKHIELAHQFSSKIELAHMDLTSHNDVIRSQVASMRKLRDGISSALPPFHVFRSKPDMVDSAKTCKGTYRDDVIKVPLLETSSATHCQVRFSYPSNDFVTGPTSFSLKLPDLIFWGDINFTSAVLDVLKEMGNFYDINSSMSSPKDASDLNLTHETLGDEKKISPCATSSLRKESLRVDISISDARIIIYPPFEKWQDFGCLVVDLKRRTTRRHGKTEASKARPLAGFQEKYPLASSCSLHINLGSAVAYLITSASKIDLESESNKKQKIQLTAHKIVSVADGADLPVISMSWQEDPLTGPWIAKRARFLASAENIQSKVGFNGKSYEFASVSKVNDIDFDNRSRQEMSVGSKFLIYAHLPPVTLSLGEFIYGKLCHLLDQLTHVLSDMGSGLIDTAKESAFNQQSVLVECDSLEISLTMEVNDSIKGSIQTELPGSWESLRLKVRNFEMFSVSNVGGIKGGSFITVSHGDGDLWGSITGSPGQEFILISCSDSAVGRGSGEGSNVLSPRHSGADIVHLWDPENSRSSLSVTVRCGTVAAVGGRLDWLEALCSFFVSNSEIEEVDDKKLEKDKESAPTGSSLFVNLVDIALSYEPYTSNPTTSESFGNEPFGDSCGNQKVACVLAASSLTLSNKASAGSLPADYKIGVQDIGLLLSVVSGFKITQNYSAEHLRKRHYVKVAQEAHIEALVRTNCENGCMWQVECSNSHIVVNTCHDTASGLTRLAGQLQQIFAPDMEESAVHLQNRWNNIRQAHEIVDNRVLNGNCSASDSHLQTSGEHASSSPLIGNLMDQICDDAFQLIGTYDSHADTPDSSFHLSFTDTYLDEPCSSDVSDPYNFVGGLPITGSKPVAGFGDSTSSMPQENIPQLIEEYFLSDLRPLSDLRSESFHKGLVNRGDIGGGSNRWYESTVKVLDNHVSEANTQTNHQVRVDLIDSCNVIKADGFNNIKGSVLLKNINVTWKMFGGSDWHDQKGVQHSSSILGRDTQTCIELCLTGIEFKYDVLPEGGINLSRICLTIHDICLNDNSNDAAWKLVLGYYKSKNHPRRSSSNALKLELESIRPDPSIPLEEYRLRVSLLPIRLHLHQTQLDFLINFFGGNSAPGHVLQDTIQDLGGPEGLSTNSINLGNHTVIQEALQPYFQKFDVSPVLIRVDYRPCHVDLTALRSGKYVELVNLVPWKGVELQLKRVQAVGIYGWNHVGETIIGEWLEDISQNQVHKLLKGLPPIRSLVAVGSGAAKLVTLPVRNYRKEKRLVKGMQRGTIAFLRSISLEAIGLGVHLAAGAHEILHQAEYILTTIPPSIPLSPQRGGNATLRSNQPNDARQGIWQACESISDGLNKSASALVQAPLKKYLRGGGVGSALATAVQAAPAAALAPASATARAVHCALLGMRNSLDPEHKEEALDKYLGKNQP